MEVPAPEAFIGRTLKQLELRPRLGLTLIAIKRQGDAGGAIATNIAPAAEVVCYGEARVADVSQPALRVLFQTPAQLLP